MQLLLKISSDINKKNRHDQEEAEDVFKPKNPIITKILIGINIFIYLFALITNQSSYFINKFLQSNKGSPHMYRKSMRQI